MLSKPLLLAIDALGLEAWQMHGEALVWLAGFATGESAALSTWLRARTHHEPCRILVNLADETYETEDLPRVRGADRRALIARRTAAWFPHPEFARAWSLGAAPDGRKGFERLVFAGLERPDELRPWLEAVRSSGARITRLIPAANLIPAVLAATVGRRANDAGPQLVAGFSRGGLRISLVDQGCVHFSRLAGHCTLAAAAQSGAWLDEIERTRDYLLSQRRLPHAASVPVRVLETADALPLPAQSRGDVRSEADKTLAFLPPQTPTVRDAGRLDTHDRATRSALDTLLIRALLQAPADLGWKPAIMRNTPLALSPRTLVLAGLIASAALGGSAWYVARAAAAAQEADPAARMAALVGPAQPIDPAQAAPEPEVLPTIDTPLAPIDLGLPDTTSLPTCPEQERPPSAPPPAAEAPAPAASRRIDGILRRPDGQALVWLDGTLVSAHEAGLQAAIGPEPALSPAGARHQRLRVGDQWAGPLPARAPQPVTAPPAATDEPAAHELAAHTPEPVSAARGSARETPP